MQRPPYLQKGDKVAIIATARKISKEEVQPSITRLEQWGLCVITGPHLFHANHQFGGTDQERASDLQWALSDPQIKAVFCARGGYGTARIIEAIDFSPFLQNPKWVIGFSDPTVLLAKINQIGVLALHGSMPILFDKPQFRDHIDSIRDAIFGKPQPFDVPPHRLNNIGSCEGQLLGGNLSLLHCSIGTSWEPKWQDAILFFEDLDEYLYHIDRIMLHLKQARVLHKISGLIVGHLSDMNDNTVPFGYNAEEIVANNMQGIDIPIAMGFPVGHLPHNEAFISGARIKLEVTRENSTLTYLSL